MRARTPRRTGPPDAVIHEIRTKLEAPVLNGGFETLLATVETIDQNVKKLNDAVYDPDSGLYFRIQKSQVKSESDVTRLQAKVDHLETRLDFYRKVVIGIVASATPIFMKFGWDLIAAHVSFH